MFDTWYKPRNTIKGQVLAEFVVEFTPKSKVLMGICQVWLENDMYMWMVQIIQKGMGLGL